MDIVLVVYVVLPSVLCVETHYREQNYVFKFEEVKLRLRLELMMMIFGQLTQFNLYLEWLDTDLLCNVIKIM